MKYKYFMQINELNKTEIHPLNYFRVVGYDKKTQVLTLRRARVTDYEDLEINIYDFLDAVTRFHRYHIENPEDLDRETIGNFVINRMLILQKSDIKENVFVEKFDAKTVTRESDYRLIIDYRDPIINTHKYIVKMGDLFDCYLDCKSDKEKTLACVMKKIEKKIRNIESVRYLSAAESRWLRRALTKEIENIVVSTIEQQEEDSYEEQTVFIETC